MHYSIYIKLYICMIIFLLHKVCKQINVLQKFITHLCLYFQLHCNAYFMTNIYHTPENYQLSSKMYTSYISFHISTCSMQFFSFLKFFTLPAISLQRNQPLNKSENNCVQITFKLSDSFAFYYILAFCQIRISLLLLWVLVYN